MPRPRYRSQQKSDEPAQFIVDFTIFLCYFIATMSYVVLARKYRPQTFDDIVGQPHITTTLKNAISQDKTAHAYLFAGPRGVGKTTTARILAKALNCAKGPTIEPCGSCHSCKEIASSVSLDVLEIDGASNRGIDEIRSLRENVKFSPSSGRFKIYIIDEVHMLTPEAFNALLKTLEEPPAHVKFIFATTQAYKVPATILSRCQRFDFRRISAKDIVGNLRKIVKVEKLGIKDDLLAMVAKYADGSLRDAQVILDQVISSSKGVFNIEEVSRMLGAIEDEVLFSLSDSIKNNDAVSALKVIDAMCNEGKDMIQLVLALIEHFRNLSIVKVSSELDSLIDAEAEKIARYRSEAERYSIQDILYVIYTFSNTLDFIRKSSIARIPVEAAVIKLAERHNLAKVSDIIDKLNKGASNVNAAAPKDIRATSVKAPEKTVKRDEVDDKPKTMGSGAASSTAVDEIEKPSLAVCDLETILSSWGRVVSAIMPKKISVASYLQEGYPVSVNAKSVTITFPKECQFHKEVLEDSDNKALIEDAIKEVLGLELRAVLVIASQDGSKTGSVNTGSTNGTVPKRDNGRVKEVEPIVKMALEMFGGDVAGEGYSPKKKGAA